MKRDLGDIIDRWSIAKLKSERIGDDEHRREFESFEKHRIEARNMYNIRVFDQYCDMMLKINDFIWKLESGLKSGKESLKNPNYILDNDNYEALAKIGASSILIRNFNSLRIDLKNIINTVVDEGFRDVKKDHLSQPHE